MDSASELARLTSRFIGALRTAKKRGLLVEGGRKLSNADLKPILNKLVPSDAELPTGSLARTAAGQQMQRALDAALKAVGAQRDAVSGWIHGLGAPHATRVQPPQPPPAPHDMEEGDDDKEYEASGSETEEEEEREMAPTRPTAASPAGPSTSHTLNATSPGGGTTGAAKRRRGAGDGVASSSGAGGADASRDAGGGATGFDGWSLHELQQEIRKLRCASSKERARAEALEEELAEERVTRMAAWSEVEVADADLVAAQAEATKMEELAEAYAGHVEEAQRAVKKVTKAFKQQSAELTEADNVIKQQSAAINAHEALRAQLMSLVRRSNARTHSPVAGAVAPAGTA